MRDDLLHEIHGNIIYFVYTYGCYKRSATPLYQKNKNQRWSYPAKIYPKVIDVLNWYPRISSSNYLYFYGGLYRRFNVPLSSEKKKTGNLIYRIEVWFLLEFYSVGDISLIFNLQQSSNLSPQKFCLKVCLSANKGHYLSCRRWVIIPKI